MNTLAERLKRAMALGGKSQAELARAAGITAVSVNDWLSGKTKDLRAVPAIKAAAFLGVKPLWLACGEGPMIDSSPSTYTVQEPQATYSNWPLPGIPPQDFSRYFTPEMRSGLVSYAMGMLQTAQMLHSGNGTRG